MAGPEAAGEGVTLWQGLGATLGTFVAVGSAIVLRVLSKKNDTAVAGDSGKHAILESASLADMSVFHSMDDNIKAMRLLLEDQVELQAEQRDRQEKDKLRERLDQADDDRREMMKMIREMRDQGAQHKPGRPLRDE